MVNDERALEKLDIISLWGESGNVGQFALKVIKAYESAKGDHGIVAVPQASNLMRWGSIPADRSITEQPDECREAFEAYCGANDLCNIRHPEYQDQYQLYETQLRWMGFQGAWKLEQEPAQPVNQATIDKALENAAEILAKLKPEGQRDKLEEWQACYAMLFTQLNASVQERKREMVSPDFILADLPEDIKETWEYLRPYVNGNEQLISLLYDLDLMPEQIMNRRNFVRMMQLAQWFKGLESSSPTSSGNSPMESGGWQGAKHERELGPLSDEERDELAEAMVQPIGTEMGRQGFIGVFSNNARSIAYVAINTLREHFDIRRRG